MDSVGYSKDLDALRDAVQLQQQMNQEIADFQRQLEEFTLAKVSLACVYFVLLKVLHQVHYSQWIHLLFVRFTAG